MRYDLMLTLSTQRSQIMECLHDALYRHAMEYLRSTRLEYSKLSSGVVERSSKIESFLAQIQIVSLFEFGLFH